MLYFKLSIHSHHFKLTAVQPRGREVIEAFAKQYVQYGLVREGRRYVRAPIKVFAARLKDHSQYRFHINQYERFIEHLANMSIPAHAYTVETADVPVPLSVELATLPQWSERPHQVPIIQYLLSPEPKKAKLVEIQTGQGKTFSALRGASFLGFRFCVIIRPMYIDKWVSDVKEILGLEGDDVIVVRGSGKLMEVIALAKAGQLQCKCLIISNKTLQNWYTLYEQLGDQILDQGYDCLPEDFMQTLQVGTRIIDEVHLDFHLNFKIDLYTHVERSISLSATLKADDPFLTRMYEVAYPRGMRYAGQPYNKYVSAFAWLYQVLDPKKIRTTEWGSTNYSHHAFEKSIVKIPNYLDDYLEMITAAVRDIYIRSYQKGDRCLVYCAGIQTCTIVKDHLKAAFPAMDIRRYVEDDPYEDVLQADISVSTLLSAGTGLDIPMLTSVVLTTAISSSQSNIQGFGRLREIKDRNLRFAYFVCTDIPKHLEYHLRKKMLLADMAKSYAPINYPVVIGH